MSMPRTGQRSGQKRGGGQVGRTQIRQDLDNRQKFLGMKNKHQIQLPKIPMNAVRQNQYRNLQNRGPVKILTNIRTGEQIPVVSGTGRAATIAKNLQHMNQAAQKKKLAQERYYGYGQGQGKSPMIRSTFGPILKQETSRGSVQQRLGQARNNGNVVKNQTAPVNNTMQGKINRLQNFNKKFQRKNMNNNQNQQIKTVSVLTGEVKYLRPLRHGQRSKQQSQPTNYTVCVENSNMKQSRSDNLLHSMPYKHHVSTDLNPAIQQEIRIIQNKSRVIPEPIISPPLAMAMNGLVDAKVPIMATRTTLHERFSMI